MKLKHSNLDRIVYIISCIVTFGAMWLTRVVISEAIRLAVKED